MNFPPQFQLPDPKQAPGNFTHAVVVLTIVIAASILDALGKLDSTTLSTVYGAAIGYASGLTVGRGEQK